MNRAAFLLFALTAFTSADTGEFLFKTHCAPCHGVHGEGGKGPSLDSKVLPRAADDTALSAVITNGIPGTGMPATRMTEEENRQLVVFIRTLAAKPPDKVQGNAEHGRDLFRGKGGCAACHRVAGEGGISGPDLTTIGLRRGPSHLHRSLVEPGTEVPDNYNIYRKVIAVPDNYLFVSIQTGDGKKYSGIRLNEDTFSIQIRDTDDKLRSFRKTELRTLDKRWGYSPMPSYAGVLTSQEIQDVVAYLTSLRGNP